jgi:aminoglycoside/choline kinase family phosphotransferase
VQQILQMPQVFVHRDYHSRNLMITRQRSPGIIDFQDALRGPAPYDVVSLLKDCHAAVAAPPHRGLGWRIFASRCASAWAPVQTCVRPTMWW